VTGSGGDAVGSVMVKGTNNFLRVPYKNGPDCYLRSPKLKIVWRFVHSQGLVFCLGTNESQRSPAEVAVEAMDYIQNVAHPNV
jgi:hypothetical protein